MHKKTFNIASVCIVTLLVAFAITHKGQETNVLSNNIEVKDGEKNTKKTTLTYQQEILKTVLDQNIKSFESVSESFKKKPTDTLSDTISKNVFSQYIEYNTSKSLDVETIQEETMEAVKSHPIQKSNIGLQNIRITGNTVANLKAYGNTVGMLQTELIKAINSVKNKENKNIYIKNLYKTIADMYMKQDVPESLAKEHAGIINGYRDYSTAFGLLELQSADPAKALTGVQLAKESQDLLVASLISVKKIVLLNNITYTKNEPAYVWFIDGSSGAQEIKTN